MLVQLLVLVRSLETYSFYNQSLALYFRVAQPHQGAVHAGPRDQRGFDCARFSAGDPAAGDHLNTPYRRRLRFKLKVKCGHKPNPKIRRSGWPNAPPNRGRSRDADCGHSGMSRGQVMSQSCAL
jgi:hypothetical protein